MKNRAQRRQQTKDKYISRIKKWFQFSRTDDKSWDEFMLNNRWVKLLKHNKLYGRSTMNNMEKHKTNKDVRKEGKKIIEKEIIEKEIIEKEIII